jgi:hypothetical protein
VRALIVLESVVMLLISTGCSGIYGLDYDYDKDTDFAELEYFDWGQDRQCSDYDPRIIDVVRTAIETHLHSKGFLHSKTQPQFLVMTLCETDQRLVSPSDPYAAAFAPYTGTLPEYYQETSILLDFVTPDGRISIWRGSISADFSQVETSDEMRKTIDTMVDKILNKFPPRALFSSTVDWRDRWLG